jgi:predicted ArsR family transcriptional regulator
MDIKGEINSEVITIISELMQDVIGQKSVEILSKRCSQDENISGKAFAYAFAEEAQDILGQKGACAILKEVGYKLAKKLMQENPQDKWDSILKYAVNDFGYASHIETEADKVSTCNCVFYEILAENNLQPTEHAICWLGWGLAEEFLKPLKNVKRIQWVNRDLEMNKCEFQYLMT